MVTSPYHQEPEELGDSLDFVTEGVEITSGFVCGQMELFPPWDRGLFWKLLYKVLEIGDDILEKTFFWNSCLKYRKD
jgi:hypothetical protein